MSIFGFVTAFLAVSVTAGDHPALKIIALLEKLQAQVKEEGAAEAADYAKYEYWCADVKKMREDKIEEMIQRITTSEADIESLSAQIEVLDEEISDLDTDLSETREAKTDATNERNTENGDYLHAKSDLEQTITAVQTAMNVLERATSLSEIHSATVAAKALIQKYQTTLPRATAFLQHRQAPEYQGEVGTVESEDADTFENRTGRVRQYDTKSGGVIEILKQLKLQFEDQLIQANKNEAESQNTYTLNDERLKDELEAMVRSKSTKNKLKSRKSVDLTAANTTFTESTSTKASTESGLQRTKDDCSTKADQWKERSDRRNGEITAMSTAVEVLKKVSHVRTPEDKGVQNLAYTGFLQISADPKSKIVNLLRQEAKKTQAKQLDKLANTIAALSTSSMGLDVFHEIKNMIEKMVFQLMAEQKDEDDHKMWCDVEVKETTEKKNTKETLRDELTTDMNLLKGGISTLEGDIAQNIADISRLERQINRQNDQRRSDTKENKETVKEAQQAQIAIDNAVAVLTDFYKSTGELGAEAWGALVQTSLETDQAAPNTWTNSYTGVTGGSGVITMLQNIASDFASMEAEAKADEASQQDTYDRWITAAAAEKSEEEEENEVKRARLESYKEKLAGKETDYHNNNKELSSVYDYEKDLEKPCETGSATYEDRKSARSSEITALRQAESILDDAFNAE